MEPSDETDSKQAINLAAVRWAYEQDGLSVTAKAVLMTFAIHADERGYTWPGVDRIASTWRLDTTTVRRQIKALLVRRKLCRTKKRRGWTGQVKVYRLPKITWERRAQCTPFEHGGSGDKGGRKAGERRAQCTPNNINKEQSRDQSDKTLGVASTTSALSNRKGNQNFVVEGYQNQHQDQPAQDHVKWPEFSKWCRSKRDRHGQPGTPTETGFWKWLSGQKPHWRNKAKQVFDETGYVLNGQFLTDEEAIRRGKENPELLTKFRRATKRDGKIQTL
jgi:hypothetical protein